MRSPGTSGHTPVGTGMGRNTEPGPKRQGFKAKVPTKSSQRWCWFSSSCAGVGAWFMGSVFQLFLGVVAALPYKDQCLIGFMESREVPPLGAPCPSLRGSALSGFDVVLAWMGHWELWFPLSGSGM